MSDHHGAPDPVDAAYARAERSLDDAAARAARRARVLGAVTRPDAAPRPAESAVGKPRVSRHLGRWLAAAGVAGLSALVGVRFYPPPVFAPPAKPPAFVASTPALPTAPVAPAPAPARAAAPAREVAPLPSAVAGRLRRDDMAANSRPSPPPHPTSAPPSADAAAPAAQEDASRAAASDRRIASPPPARPAPSRAGKAAAPAVLTDMAARLRAAAVAGRVSELTTLLGQGAPVDAPDEDGETALMKTIERRHLAAAALLRRYGAGLDVRNQAGVSARDMALSIDDPKLNEALGLVPDAPPLNPPPSPP